MGVYVKGMEMPKSCYDCPLTNDGFYLCKGIKPYKQLETECEERKPDWCPLSDVPTPHGRLIDANVAYDKIAEAAGEESGNYVDMDVVDRGLSETPTIIEAEE